MTWAIRRTTSSRSIHDIHCRPLPIGPPRPNSNGIRYWLSMPPSMPSTSPIRSRTTRTPRRCAFLASRSQAVADPMREAALAAVEFGQRLVLPQAVPADRGAADHHRGTLLQACDQPVDRARGAQARRQNPAALAPRPQRIADRLAGEIDHGIDPRVVRDLREVGDDPQRRPQRRRLGSISRENRHVVARAGQRFDQAAADEAGRAGDQHVLPVRQRIDERSRIA